MGFLKAMIEGTVCSLVGGCVLALIVLLVQGGYSFWLVDPSGFASRWEGTCTGWTKRESVVHILGNLLHWWSYCSISFVFWRLHPTMSAVPYSRATIILVGWFIFGCGFSHLVSAFSVFFPWYFLEGRCLIVNGIFSCVAAVFVAYALEKSFGHLMKKEEEIAFKISEMERKFHADESD